MSTSMTVSDRRSEAELIAEWEAFYTKSIADQKPPKGAINAKKFAKIAKCTAARARMTLMRREERGELRSDMFRVKDARGCTREERYWWFRRK